MKISEIKMTKINNEDSRMKAIVTLTFDNCVTIRDIKIVQASNGFFVAMPARKNKEGNFVDVCYSINSEFREYVSREVLNLYNSEKTEHIYEGEFTKPKIEILVEPINDSDVIVANLKVTFDNNFCISGVKVLKLKDENNKIIFAFPSRKTIVGEIIHICEIVGYYDEYYSQLFDAFEKEISKKSGANIQVENENLKKHKLIASVFYPQTIGMIIDNINNAKELNEKESIIKLISESSNKFEEINNEVIVYFYNDAKVVYIFENNKLQSAVGTLEDGKSYAFDRNIVEDKKAKLENKDESTLKEFSQQIEGYPTFKFYFPVNLGEYVKVAPTVFEIKEDKTQKVRVMISKCENGENGFKLGAREWIEKNKKENSMDEISHREEMINNTLIEAYVLKYTNRNDLPFKIYKMGYVNGYRITISGWQMDNTEEIIDNAFKNIKVGTNEKSMPDKSKNIAENIESENDSLNIKETKKYCETSKEDGLRELLKSILDNNLINQEKRILSSAEILNIMLCNLMNARNFLDENKESLAKEPTDISKRQRGTYEDFCNCIKQKKYESAYWELVDFVDDYGDSHNNEVSVWESKFLTHEVDDFRSAVEPLLHGITYYRTQNVGDEINFGVLGKYSFSEIESDSDDAIKSVIKLLNENIAVFDSKVLFYMFSNLKDTAYPFWEYNNFYKFLTVKPTWGNTQFSTNIYNIEITPENIMDVLNSNFKFIIMEKIKDDILIKNVNINENLNMLSIEFEGFCNKFNALIEMDYKNNFEVVSFHAS